MMFFSEKRMVTAISYLIMFSCIVVIIPLGLFPCFFSGFLVYEIIISMAFYFERFIGIYRARWFAVLIIIVMVIMTITVGVVKCTNFFIEDINRTNLFIEINRIFSEFKRKFPSFLPAFLPNTAEELKDQIFSWIELNLILIRNMGHTFLHGCVTLLIGLVLGVLVACSKFLDNSSSNNTTYFVDQLLERIINLSKAFHNIVFAQIKISLVNTFLTFIMIFLLLPLFDKVLPLGKTLIFITFILGLLPIVGNLVSNVIITISALSISLSIGIIMFIYLILIHKLEYFLNAEIIGNRINANSWELILAMLFLESIFGLEGLIAAPIFYAYLKIELRSRRFI